MKTEIVCNHSGEGHVIHSNTCDEMKKDRDNKERPPIKVSKHIETETPPIPLKSAGT